MFADPPRSLPQRLGFLLVPRFSLMAFSAGVEPLRIANTLSGRRLYEWQVISADGAPVEASNRMSIIAEAATAAVDFVPTLVVCASYEPLQQATPALYPWLRRLARRGADLGALDTGSFLLARAGLLDGYQATAHWETLESFAERFPEVTVTQEIFTVDRERFTCSGGMAGLDMMLHLIRRQHGQPLAAAVSEEFIYHQVRQAGDPQRLALGARLGTRDRRLIRAVAAMEAHIDEPLSIAAIARAANLSERHLERLFRRDLKCGPARYYSRLRLERARNLLRQTSSPVIEIAVGCGFASAASFSRAYSEAFGLSPSRDRRDQP